jgi:branched-chain amino acid transport system substrate-binding protein
MFGCWETLFSIKEAVEASGYKGPADKQKLVEAIEATTGYDEGKGHPQGKKQFHGKAHQMFGSQFISEVKGGKLNVVHTSTIEDSLYEPKADYTKLPL